MSIARRPLFFILLPQGERQHPVHIAGALCLISAAEPFARFSGGGPVFFYLELGAGVLGLGVFGHGGARLPPHLGEHLVLCGLDPRAQPRAVLLRGVLDLFCLLLGFQQGVQDEHIRRGLPLQPLAPLLGLALGADLLLRLYLLHGIQKAPPPPAFRPLFS